MSTQQVESFRLNESEKDVLQGMDIIVLVLHHVIVKQRVWGGREGLVV